MNNYGETKIKMLQCASNGYNQGYIISNADEVMEDTVATFNPSRIDCKTNAIEVTKRFNCHLLMLEALQEYVNSYEENRSQIKAMTMAKNAIKVATNPNGLR